MLHQAGSNWLPLWRVSSAKASCWDTALRYGRSRIIAGAALGEPVVRRCGLQAGALAPRLPALCDVAQRAQQRHADAAQPGLGLVVVADHPRPQRAPGDEARRTGRATDAQVPREHLGRAAATQEYPRSRPADSVELFAP